MTCHTRRLSGYPVSFFIVIPAEAGIQPFVFVYKPGWNFRIFWIPAFAGMTMKEKA